MAQVLSTRGLARVSAHHPWTTVLLWLVAAVGIGVAAFGIAGSRFTSDIAFTNEQESQVVRRLLEQYRGPQPLTEMIVVQSDTRTVDDPAYQQFVTELTASVRALTADVDAQRTFNYYEVMQQHAPQAAALVSADRKSTLIATELLGDIDSAKEHVAPFLSVLHAHQNAGYTVVPAGYASVQQTWETIAKHDLEAEQRTMPVALIILVLVFGALIAALVPLALSILGIVLATGVAYLVSQIFPLSVFVTNMIVMIGLALGIDYALFIIQRYREERQAGRDKLDAIEVAGDTASRAVLFSGLTVIISLAGMLIVPTNLFRALGAGAIFAAVFAVLIGLTLLPAVLSLLGDRVNRFALPWVSRRGDGDADRGFWAGTARLVMSRPWVSMIGTAGLLIALSIPYFGIHLGNSGASSFPHRTDAYRAFDILNRDFSVGQSIPTEIVVSAPDVKTPAVAQAIERMQTALRADSTLRITPGPSDGPSPDGTLSLTTIGLPGDAASSEATAALHRIRDEIIPQAFAGVDATARVGGQSAQYQDFFDVVHQYTPFVFVFVLGFSFILLMIVFRSIVVPIKAIIMNLLSVGAAYGLLVLVFQHGVLINVFGFQRSAAIDAWVPLFLFMILFGLSMDYQVFLLSRIRERYDRTRDNAESVASGLRSTANIITGAAAIMIAVFGGFALGDLVMFQQFGFGLAVAVLIDATIVRMVLVPATMRLLGDRNWYLPRWLEWLPDLRVEG